MVEYKVITEQDSKTGKFDPASLQTTLNDHAAQGWRVATGFLASSLWKSSRSSIVVILERETAG